MIFAAKPLAVVVGYMVTWFGWVDNLLFFEYADFENGCVTIQEKTLGMNTGLRDKNNHEIYGGDILAHNGRVIGHVVDGVRGYCFDVVYADPVSTSTWSLYGIVVNDYEGDVEVVGNIYDNPEMVKKGGTV